MLYPRWLSVVLQDRRYICTIHCESLTKKKFALSQQCFLVKYPFQIKFIFIVWIEEPTMEILESTSYSVGNVDFPTVTLCSKSSNPDRWGPVMKIFDHLNVVCSDK